MATEVTNGINNKNGRATLCRYFAYNVCRKGDSCEFSHDRNAKPDMVCRYYQNGACFYGTKCRYDHVKPKNRLEELAQSTNGSGFLKSSHSPEIRPMSDKSLQAPQSSSQSNSTIPSKKSTCVWDFSAFNKLYSFDGLELADGCESAIPPTFSRILASARTPSLPIESGRNSPKSSSLCPYYEQIGECIDGDNCKFVHGLCCDMCLKYSLHPLNEQLRINHHRECLAQHEKDMEAAFAKAISADKQCGVCMEQIVEKGLRFGILENCNHCFCLDCIRKWRTRSDQFETSTVRACPECRVKSDYVIPSSIWYEDTCEKDKLVDLYKQNVKKIQCKYIKSDNVDECPFGNKCFYKHQLPDGKIVAGQSPKELRKKRRLLLDINSFLTVDTSSDSSDNDDSENISSIITSILRNNHNY